MSGVTQVLKQIESGDPSAADQLLPLVYDELRKLAAVRLNAEKPGQTLQATALVHEAYVRLVEGDAAQQWNSRGHFFAAAAEAMRRILVENARRKRSRKHGGEAQREDFDLSQLVAPELGEDLLALDEALNQLAKAGCGQGGTGQAAALRRADRGAVGRGAGDLADDGQPLLGLCTGLAAPGDYRR